MSRLRELFHDLKVSFPDDSYLKSVDQSLVLLPQLRSVVATYDRALRILDIQSWDTLREKTIGNFHSIKDRGKQPFFNQLNEAFAFRFLLQQGYKELSFVPEDNDKKKRQDKTPDIRFKRNNSWAFCEVKTLSESVDEIDRMKSGNVFDCSIYEQLEAPFLETKLPEALNSGFQQVRKAGSDGLVFIVAKFDDFTLRYYPIYRRQITEVLNSQFPEEEVYVKIGIQGRKHLHHRPFG